MSNIINIGYREPAIIGDAGELHIGFPFFYGSRYSDCFRDNDMFSFEKQTIENKYNIKFPLTSDNFNNLKPEINKDNISINFPDNFLYPIDNAEYNRGVIKDFIEKKENFYIPIFFVGEELFEIEPEIIEEEVADYIRLKKAAFLLQFPMEGYIGRNDISFKWLHKFVEVNKLPNTSILFVVSNFKIKETYQAFLTENNLTSCVTFLPYNYFEHELWFVNHRYKLNEVYLNHHTGIKDNLIQERKKRKFFKHFSFMSRRFDLHRLITFSHIKANGNLNKTSLCSFFNPNSIPNTEIKKYLTYDYWKPIANYKNVIKFVDSTDFSVPFLINNNFRSGNTDNLAETLDMYTHNAALICIITESLYNKESIFFSEKTFKPIYTLNPFFLVGNTGSLKELKKLGYKTFDNWWDESYDEEPDLVLRLNKLYTEYQKIAEWSIDKINQVYEEMQPILLHNFNVLMSKDGITSFTESVLSHFNTLNKE